MADDNNKLVKGTLILALAGLLARGIGSIYRIALPRLIGAEGVGLYHMAYHVFTLALFLTTPGIPLAMSRMIALARSKDRQANIALIMRASFILLLILGLGTSLLVFFGAESLARLFFNDPRVAYPLQAIAPAIFFISIISVFRGLFQGQNQMLPTAISQVVEQIVRIATMFVLLLFVLRGPMERLAVGATLACVFGEMAGFISMLLMFIKEWPFPWSGAKGATISIWDSYKVLLGHALPIGFSSMIIPLMSFVNSGIITRRLQLHGFTSQEIVSLYGQYSGMALALYHFPLVIISALSINLVPVISELFGKKDLAGINQKMMKAVGATTLLTMPAAVGFIVMGSPVCELLFGYPQAGNILGFVAPSIVFLGLQLTLSGVLQGLGYVLVPLMNLLIGALCNGALTYLLTGYLGIIGAAIGTGMGYVVAGTLNMWAVGKRIGLVFDVQRQIFLPFLASTTMGVLVFYLHLLLNRMGLGLLLETLLPIFLGVLYYIFFIIIFKGVEPHDIEIIPLIGTRLSSLIK